MYSSGIELKKLESLVKSEVLVGIVIFIFLSTISCAPPLTEILSILPPLALTYSSVANFLPLDSTFPLQSTVSAFFRVLDVPLPIIKAYLLLASSTLYLPIAV